MHTPSDRSSIKATAGIMTAVACTGIATILFEILLTRIFSVTMWYHFAFMAISLALFGISVSGAAIFLARRVLTVDRTLQILGGLSFAFALAIPLAFLADLHIPFLPFDLDVLGYADSYKPYFLFTAKFLVLSLPFFLSGAIIGLAFTNLKGGINRIYFADLTGGAFGCLLVVPMLLFLSGPSAIIATGAFPLLGGILFFRADGRRLPALAGAAGLIFLIGLVGVNEHSGFVRITRIKSYRPSKGQEIERPKLMEQWHPVSRVAVHPIEVSSAQSPWFYSKVPENGFPRGMEITNDGGARTQIYPRQSKEEAHRFFLDDASDIAYSVLQRPRVLVVGVGGGKDITGGLALGASEVVGVELNPVMIKVVQQTYGDFSGRPYLDPRVRLVINEGRNYIAGGGEPFDLIKMSVTDTWTAASSGSYALAESYLYTRESIQDCLARLKPGGILSITRWYPQETVRLVSLVSDVLRASKVEHPERRIAFLRVLSNQPTCTVLIRNGEFTPQDRSALEARCQASGHHLIYAPGLPVPEKEHPFDLMHRLAMQPSLQGDLSTASRMDLSSPTDDRPFFFNLVTFSTANQGSYGSQGGFMLQHGRALTLLVALLKISLVVSVIFLLGPLFLFAGKSQPGQVSMAGRLVASLYFLALGVGFMLVEIPLMQRFTLFLGHPLYSLTVVLFTVLLFSGIGSLASSKLTAWSRLAPWWIFAASLAYLAILIRFMPAITHGAIGASLGIRIGITIVGLAPLALMMGVPFPFGLGLLQMRAPSLVPWAWAMNGVGSVAAPVIAMILAIAWGFNRALLLGMVCYLLAAGLLFLLQQQLRQGGETPV